MSLLPALHRPGLLVLLSAAATLGLACQGGAPAPHQGPATTPVTVVTLQSQSVLLTRELPGRTSALAVGEVRPRVNGIIERQLFTEGSMVKAGQPLYQLDDALYRADYSSAKAALERAQVTLTIAEQNAKRAEGLFKEKATSEQDHEVAVATFHQAQADLKAAQAAMERAGVTLSYTRIPSPLSGRIGKSSMTPGALVTANQPQALTSVQQLDPIYVDLTQSSSELLQLRKEVAAGRLEATQSTPVTILLEDGSRFEHEGKLTFSDVTVDQGTGSYSLRVVVPNPDHVLLPGMYVRALVGSGVRQQGVLVPQQGIARDPKGNTSAMVVGKDGKVEVREVKVSRTVGDHWLVESGLTEGDRVIVEGLQKVQPGSQVEATEAAPKGAKQQVPEPPTASPSAPK